MPTQINESLDDETHRELKAIKDELGISWEEAIIRGIRSLTSDAEFEVYQDRVDEWRWRLVHANGNVLADSGEGYATKQKVEQGIASIKSNAAGAHVHVQGDG